MNSNNSNSDSERKWVDYYAHNEVSYPNQPVSRLLIVNDWPRYVWTVNEVSGRLQHILSHDTGSRSTEAVIMHFKEKFAAPIAAMKESIVEVLFRKIDSSFISWFTDNVATYLLTPAQLFLAYYYDGIMTPSRNPDPSSPVAGAMEKVSFSRRAGCCFEHLCPATEISIAVFIKEGHQKEYGAANDYRWDTSKLCYFTDLHATSESLMGCEPF